MILNLPLFLLKFLYASSPSVLKIFLTSLELLIFPTFKLELFLIASSGDILAAFIAGIKADINIVSSITRVLIINTIGLNTTLKSNSPNIEVLKNVFITLNTISIATVPLKSPIGIPTILTKNPSKNTSFIIWDFVAPIEFNIPNCFLRSLIAILNELYIVDIVAIITSEATRATISINVVFILSYELAPNNLSNPSLYSISLKYKLVCSS